MGTRNDFICSGQVNCPCAEVFAKAKTLVRAKRRGALTREDGPTEPNTEKAGPAIYEHF